MNRPVDHVDELTPTWLSHALGVGVAAVATEPIGHGQIGENHRLFLTYEAGPGTGPPTLVAKFGAGTDRSIVAGGYRKEVAFYRDFAATVAVRTPGCHHAARNDDGSVFTLLLDDLAPAEPGDQLAGCGPARARAAVVNLAGLHGPRWGDPALFDHPELEGVDPEGAAFLGDIFDGAVTTFVDRYRADLDGGVEPLLRRVAGAIPSWITAQPERFTLLHGDYRLDNLLFAPGGDGGVHAVDWQTLTVGHPGRDLAYFCETSLEPEVRRAHQDDLVASYSEALAGHGVAPGTVGLDDLRLGTLQGPLITVLGAVYATAERSERADAMFLTMLRRSLAAIEDLDPFALV